MSRRSGKAASRRARQKRHARPPAPTPGVGFGAAAEMDRTAPPPPAAAAPAAIQAPVSRLSQAAELEYHYVGRDLRNIGVLVLVMAALLAVAVIVVNLAGIAPS